MNKRPGTEKTLAILLALIMTAQTGIMAAAEEISATIEDVEPLTITATIEESAAEDGEDTVGEEPMTESGAVVVSNASEVYEAAAAAPADGRLTPISISGDFEGAEKLFDGDPLTYVEAGGDRGAVFTVEEPVQLTGVKIIPRNEYGIPPTEFEAISNDGVIVHEWVEGFGGEGADMLFDDNLDTKWCHASPWSYVIWEMPGETAIDGYRLITANDNAAFHGRNPKNWILYGSNNYDSDTGTGDWEVIDSVQNDQIMQNVNFIAYDFFTGSQAAYKYYQIEFFGTESGTFQLSGLNLLNLADDSGSQQIEAIDMVEIYEDVKGFTNEGSENLFDYNETTKYSHTSSWSYVIWEVEGSASVIEYQFITANDNAEYPGRNPNSWVLYGCNDYDPNTGDGDWKLIHEVENDEVLQDVNYAPYTFTLDEAAPYYKYYQIEFGSTDSGSFQLSGLNLFGVVDHTRTEGITQNEREWAQRAEGVKIQGSTDGEEWITLYRVNQGFPQPGEYYIDADMFGSVVDEFAFTKFRVINDATDLVLADVVFYGEANADLDAFPTQEELTEPIYSCVDAEQILSWNDLGDGAYVWDDHPNNPHYLYRDYENPVMIIGAALPYAATVNVDTINIGGTVHEVIGFAPYAFENEKDLKTLYLDGNMTYVHDRGLADCRNLETIYVGSSLRVMSWDSLIWCPGINVIEMIEDVTDADTRDGHYPIVEDGCLIVNGMLVRHMTNEYVSELILPDEVRVVGARAFEYSYVERIEFPNVEELCYTALVNSAATEMVFSEKLSYFPNETFYFCDNLTSLTIPRNLVELEHQSYDGNTNTWSFGGDLFRTYSEELGYDITDTAQPLTIYTYDGNLLTYYINDRKEDGLLSNVTIEPLTDIIWTVEEVDGVENIITRLTAPEDVRIAELPSEVDGKQINGISGHIGYDIKGNHRFGDENGHLVIPEGYKFLWYNTFQGCGQLKSVELPESLSEIDTWAFQRTSLSEISIPANCDKIFEGAFRDCPNLTKVTINSQASVFNENSIDYPFNDIFDMNEETGKTVPVIEVWQNSGAHRIGQRSGWNMASLGIIEIADNSLNTKAIEIFGSDPRDGDENVVYQNAFDGDPNTYFHADDPSYGVGIGLDEPVQITEVFVTPYAPNNPGITMHENSGGNNRETADLLFDYREDTKWCVGITEDIEEIYVVFSLPEAESIYGYQIMTANDMEEYPGRNPESWTLYGSNDYDPDMLSDGTWTVLDSVQNDEKLQDINYELYEYSVDNTTAYQYYKLVIHETKGSEVFQMADFNLLYDGCSNYEMLEEARGFVDSMEGIKLQGSVDGENWVTIHRIPWDDQLSMAGYRISGDVMSNVAHEYTFNYFRLINDTRDLIVADVEFYGETRDDLAVFPQMDEITEPIYSYVNYDVILQYSAYNFDDNGYLWDQEGLDLTISKEFENPVMLVDAMFPTDFDGDWTVPNTVSDGETTYEIIGIAPFAFKDENEIQSVAFADNTRYVCEFAFSFNNSIKTVTLNKEMREISDGAFYLAEGLTAFIGDDESLTAEEKARQYDRYYEVYDGYLVYSGDTLAAYPISKNIGGSFTIPDFIEIIRAHVFVGSKLTSLDLGSSVREIHWAAISETQLEELTLSPSLEYIDGEAFRWNEKLTSIEIPASVNRIGNMIVLGCNNLDSIYLYPTNLTDIDPYAFYYGYYDPSEINDYPTLYVYEGSVTEQTLSDLGYEYQYIESDAPIYSTYEAEDGIHLEHVTQCGFTDFVIPEGVVIVDRGAFDMVENITSVTFPKTLVEVQSGTFAGREEFTVNWGGAVPVQYEGAFGFDVAHQYDGEAFVDGLLYALDADTKTAAVEAYWYSAIDENGTLEVPSEVTVDGVTYDVIAIISEALMYKGADEFMINYADINGIRDQLNEDSYGDGVQIRELIISDSVIYIGWDAFSHRDDMKTVELSRNLVFMEPNFSYNNWNLTTVTGLDEYGTEDGGRYQLDGNMIINTYADDMVTFYPMANEDTAVWIAPGVQRIRYEAFNNNDFIKEVRIPPSMHDIQGGAFIGCDNIMDFIFPEGNDTYYVEEDYTIRTDENGERLVAYPYGRIPENGILKLSDDISFISPNVFRMATNLTELIIPASCRNIDDWAIEDNPNLWRVQIYGTMADPLNLDVFANNQNLSAIDYFGEKLELYWYEFDKFPIRIATDIYGEHQCNEDGTPVYGEKVILTIADKECEPVLFTMNSFDWENEDSFNFETYSIDNNPYVDVVYGDTVVYNVTYSVGNELLGGYYVPPVQHKIAGVPLTITEEPAENYRGEFLGWSTDPDSDVVEYAPGSTYSTDADITLYPVWDADIYTLYIEANGGIAEETAMKMNTVYGYRAANIGVVRQGYRFLGWAEQADSDEVVYTVDDVIWPNEEGTDITVYAVWQEEPTYTVNYDLNGAEGTVDAQTAQNGETITLNGAPVREGYTFAGWAYDQNAIEADFEANASYSYEIPVYTIDFENPYKISMDNAEIVRADLNGNAIRIKGAGEGTNLRSAASANAPFQQTIWEDGMTISLWGKADASDTLSGSAPLYSLYMPGDGYIAATASLHSAINTDGNDTANGISPRIWNDPDLDAPSALTADKWQLVTAVYREDGVYIYRDGELVSSSSYNYSDPETDETVNGSYADLAEQLHEVLGLEIGSWSCKWWNFGDFEGLIDEIAIYDDDLTEAEIADAMNGVGAYNSDENRSDITLYAVWTEEDEPVTPAESVEISVEGGTAKAGETVDVVIKLNKNPGIASVNFKVNFDPSVLTLSTAVRGDALADFEFTPGGKGSTAGTYGLLWNGTVNDTSTGVLATLTFTVSEDAADGEYPVTVTWTEEDIFDENEDNVPAIITDGKVTVQNILYGDINRDGFVDGIDVILLSRYIVGGYDINTFDEDAADVNVDGKVNAKDLTRIRRYITGGFDVELGK